MPRRRASSECMRRAAAAPSLGAHSNSSRSGGHTSRLSSTSSREISLRYIAFGL
ncbi:hypothetical protein ACFPM0_27885 [Pseudonocardia sulfidoxydans]|uniref:hypothetical protein n=1 Tax=Pseudonocardia sulfidoxydans TaxID=54011 RepID=UPI0036243E59